MHQPMIDEVPPNDGHRQTIIFPFHTHVGFGIALNGRSLRLDELYLARYFHLDSFPRKLKPKSTVGLTDRPLTKTHFLHGVDVCFGPAPRPPSVDWLREKPHSISLPPAYVHLRPRAPAGTAYIDGGTGDFEWDQGGRFRVRAQLSKDEPGIYTL